MKRLSIASLLTLTLCLLTAGAASAQQSSWTDTASASATIVPAIAISNTASLDASGARTATGGVALGNAADVGAATFRVTGEPNASYSLTLPSSGSRAGTSATTRSVSRS